SSGSESRGLDCTPDFARSQRPANATPQDHAPKRAGGDNFAEKSSESLSPVSPSGALVPEQFFPEWRLGHVEARSPPRSRPRSPRRRQRPFPRSRRLHARLDCLSQGALACPLRHLRLSKATTPPQVSYARTGPAMRLRRQLPARGPARLPP